MVLIFFIPKNTKENIHYKSNCDVEMAIDAVLDVNTFDVLVLFSGDSDFVYLIKVLQNQFQKKVVVYSSRKTIAWELKLTANDYFFLEDFKKKIKKINSS
ncbi:MAG: NYN domain-containing protein [Patescibacteria group bacterium]|nr:NYN domain-containing protein [Patescibacteria group bacterium]